MKELYIILIGLLLAFQINAQKSTDNSSGVVITPLISEGENLPGSAEGLLKSKLTQMLTKNGVSGGINSRFVITAHFDVLGKELISSAPVKLVYDFEISIFIGDGLTGDIFASNSISAKGIGTNDTKAYISAIKNIRPSGDEYKHLISGAKKEIIEFYNSRCNLIVSAAKRHKSLGNHGAAIAELTQVPVDAKSCVDTTVPLLESLYKSYVKNDCTSKLNKAQGLWSANQTMEAAYEVGKLLSTVSPDALCFDDVKQLYNTVSTAVKEDHNKAWEYLLLKEGQEDSKIQAIRDIGVAYGENQPQPVYLISGWW